MKMVVCRQLLLALSFGAFVIVHLVHGQPNQQGFISLDCGLPPNESPYTDSVTGLIYLSDADFIQSGKHGEIGDDYKIYTSRQSNDLRYFPDGIRNCYSLTVNKGTNYLIRAGFSYGNYDGLDVIPEFDLHVGPNLWTAVHLNSGNETDREIIYMSKSNVLQICLVKTGETIPMISTLELRPLRNDSYMTQFGPLSLYIRNHCKRNSDGFIRYPDDVFDRKWDQTAESNTIDVNTTLSLNSSSPFEVPDVVQTLSANDTREFDIMLENNIIHTAYSPKRLQSDTKYNILPTRCSEAFCFFSLVRTKRSTLPPLVNAIEAFTVLEFPYADTNSNDVAAMKSIQTTYGLNIISWQGDPCVPEQLKWEDIKCSYTNKSDPPIIISLNLSSSGLTGSIPSVLQNLTRIEELDLSNNSFSGNVPAFLANIKSLSLINLSGNNLSGSVPQPLLDRVQEGLVLKLEGNPDLCRFRSCNRKEKKGFLLPVIASAASVLVVVVVVALIFVFKKKKVPSNIGLPKQSEPSFLSKKMRFTYTEVQEMTNSFERVLGEGGFGVVYHGCINGTQQVAVKLLSQSSSQGYKHFKAEVELLMRVHHINLVSLVGYCDEGDHLALIYEYMSNGDLKQHISGNRGGFVLSWETRLKIAANVALGLEYLHIGCKPAMVHRDIKCTNILLDEHYQAKLADFGLSRSFSTGSETYVSTVVAGTPGYLDPEYYQTNWLTEKSDIYSFGIVLLEIITNRPIIEQSREKPHIVEWVEFMIRKCDIENIVDPNLHRNYDIGSVWKAIELAMSCVSHISASRPNMSRVVHDLKECLISETSRTGESRQMDSVSCI